LGGQGKGKGTQLYEKGADGRGTLFREMARWEGARKKNAQGNSKGMAGGDGKKREGAKAKREKKHPFRRNPDRKKRKKAGDNLNGWPQPAGGMGER